MQVWWWQAAISAEQVPSLSQHCGALHAYMLQKQHMCDSSSA
jgi:hypothetical protein